LSLHGLLLARLDELPLSHQNVLKRAAVMGLAFEYAGLLKLCQPQLGEAEVALALEEAVQAAFLTVLHQGFYQFNHPLLQEAIYTTLAFSQRQRWHTQVGDWLVESQPDSEQSLELIAYHYLQGGEVEKAARFARRAGDKARKCGVYPGATAYYAKVLALTNAPLEERAGAAEGQADILALQGDYRAAKLAYTQAIELGSLEAVGKQAILSGEADILARTQFTPALRPWAEGARAWLLAQRSQPEAASTLLQAALDTAEEKVRPALAALAQTLAAKGQLGPYEEWLSQFAQIALSQSLPVASFNQV
jgi:predicted ATPase